MPSNTEFVVWCDGDNSQLATIAGDKGIKAYEEHNVIACKHGAAPTGAEQGNYLGKVFIVRHGLNKTTTVQDYIPGEDQSMFKDVILRELAHLEASKL